MKELLDVSFAPANFVLTLFAILVLIYWVVIIFTGLDIEATDLDGDSDLTKPDVGQGEGQGFWQAFVEFMYIGELPIMFILSIVIFSMWLINVNVTAIFGITDSFLGFLVYFPGFIISLLITKVVAKPFVKLYAMFNHKGEVEIDFIGKVGRVTSPMTQERLGQIEIQLSEDVLKVYAKSLEDETISFGETVMILEESVDKKYYLVQKYTS
jgi:hypothetical protein